MAKLNFNTQDTPRMPARIAPEKYRQSDVKGVFEISDGIRPWLVAYPYKHLPVMRKDVSTEDYIAINHGKIVSMISNMNETMESSGGLPNIDVGASGYAYDSAVATGADIQKVSIDTSYFGYDDSVASLTVPANGGSATTLTYTALDEAGAAATYKPDGSIAAANDTIVLPANYPVGVVTEDVYQDIRGRYLNYQMWGAHGILCDYYVEVPYYDTNGDTSITFGTSPSDSVYNAVYRTHGFALINSATAGAIPGMLVKPDQWGEYSLTTTNDIQTIGRMLVTDARYPKGLLELVDTYPGSETAGTDTGGLPGLLYKFVKSALSTAGSAYGIQDIVTAVQNGSFGVARIQLNI